MSRRATVYLHCAFPRVIRTSLVILDRSADFFVTFASKGIVHWIHLLVIRSVFLSPDEYSTAIDYWTAAFSKEPFISNCSSRQISQALLLKIYRACPWVVLDAIRDLITQSCTVEVIRTVLTIAKASGNFPIELTDLCLATPQTDDLTRLTCGLLLAEIVSHRPPDSWPPIVAYAAECVLHDDSLFFTLGCVLLVRLANLNCEVAPELMDRVQDRAIECATEDAFLLLGRDPNPTRAPTVVCLALDGAAAGDLRDELVKERLSVVIQLLPRIETREIDPIFLNNSLADICQIDEVRDLEEVIFQVGEVIVSYFVRIGVSVIEGGLPVMFRYWLTLGTGEAFAPDFVRIVSICFAEGVNRENMELKMCVVDMLFQGLKKFWEKWQKDLGLGGMAALSLLCRMAIALGGVGEMGEVLQVVREWLAGVEDEHWRMVMTLELLMSVALVGGPGEEALAMLEHAWVLVANYHRLLLASFLAARGLQESPMFAAVMNGISAPVEWAGKPEHVVFDELVCFLPEMEGFVVVNLPTEIDVDSVGHESGDE
jgi:hypothetical protein